MKKFAVLLCMLIPCTLSDLAIPFKFHPEISCVAQTIYYEARGESLKGKIAVAHVVLNRTKHKAFPKNTCDVITQPGQFPWRTKGLGKAIEYYDLATEVVNGKYDRYNLGALYFHNKTVMPRWNKQKVAVIGNHVFYK